MEQNMEQNIKPNIEPGIEPKSKKYPIVLIIGAVVVLIGLGIWYWQIQTTTIPTAPATAPLTVEEDSTSAIDQELDSVDIGDLDKEFQAIDADLNSL